MKRIGIAVLALAVLLSAIACGSGIEAQAQPTTAPAATEQAMLPPTETPTEEPVETPQPLRIEDLAGKWRMTPEEIEEQQIKGLFNIWDDGFLDFYVETPDDVTGAFVPFELQEDRIVFRLNEKEGIVQYDPVTDTITCPSFFFGRTVTLHRGAPFVLSAEAEAFLGTWTLVSVDVTGHLYAPEELNQKETLELKRDGSATSIFTYDGNEGVGRLCWSYADGAGTFSDKDEDIFTFTCDGEQLIVSDLEQTVIWVYEKQP